MISQNVFRLLNVEHTINSASDWNSNAAEKLWLYTLHYHEWLSADRAHVDTQRSLISRWLDENPSRHGVGWDAYPISIRTVQWIKWLARGHVPVDGMLDSLATQIRYLRRTLETHLGANHLFSNAIALTASGIFFEGAEAEEWLNGGLSILAREFPKQFLADGGHFELSPSYHALLLESILDIENLAHAYGLQFIRPWTDALVRIREWLAVMTRPDGTLPQFNDCAQGVAPSPVQIEAYAKAIGLEPTHLPSNSVIDLPNTGYTRLRNSTFDVFFDAGPFAPRTQPGHGHCDMLSFELSIGGRTTIVNGGVSTYERSARRSLERSTKSHNTVQLENIEQTEIWSAFRAGRSAQVKERIVKADSITASHDGNRSIGIIHRRGIRLLSDKLVIKDEMLGRAPPKLSVARVHFVPGIIPEPSDGTIIAGPLVIATCGEDSIEILDYEYAPEFNCRIPAKVLEISFKGQLETIVRQA